MTFAPRSLEDLALEWPAEITHFSASSAKMAVRCEEQWRQRYILGKKAPPNLKMIGGKADHEAIERSMVQKVDTHVDLPTPEVKEAYVEVVEREVELSGGLNELHWEDGATGPERVRQFDDIRDNGQLVVETYHRSASPTIQPLAVEKEITITVPGIPVPVIGYIDLIARDVHLNEQLALGDPFVTDEEATRIIDRKRRKRASTKIEPEWSIQAEVYQLAEPYPHDWHITTYGVAKPQVLLPRTSPTLVQQVPDRKRSELLLQQIVSKIGWLYMKYGPDAPWPTTGKLHPWACGYCAYRNGCWGWA